MECIGHKSTKCKKLIRLSPKSKKKRVKESNGMDGCHSADHIDVKECYSRNKLPNGFTDKESQELKQAFNLFDKNNDGKISSEELGCVMRMLRHNYTQEDIDDMIKNADTNENGFVEFDEFVVLMRRWHQNTEVDGAAASSSVSPISNEKQLEAFKVFDMDGNGYIDKHELRYTMRRLGENLSEEDIKEMFKEADLNGDGMIDFNEFTRLLHHLVPDPE
ncbi:neo-calmodulin-like isoform X3 [Mizuhopecten yessoensis]|uniref:neo-calmodulin-like isoform X3 n=1 Tax=Mizuhopecten yessoensis TaxID=6573 RepID=UPI000B45C355|nr:neo-calmodulin-like isoform X3 [Mizuhopecten yessoensis]